MSKRQIDRTKKSNIKCEHCKHFRNAPISTLSDYCALTKEKKEYYQRCKRFEWKEEEENND